MSSRILQPFDSLTNYRPSYYIRISNHCLLACCHVSSQSHNSQHIHYLASKHITRFSILSVRLPFLTARPLSILMQQDECNTSRWTARFKLFSFLLNWTVVLITFQPPYWSRKFPFIMVETSDKKIKRMRRRMVKRDIEERKF